MADTYTTNLNLTKPEPGAAEDTWGISLNADLDALDAIFGSGGTAVSMGVVTLDGLTVDGVGSLDNNGLNLELSSSNTGIIYDAQNGYHTFKRNGTNALQINGGNGDIAFYEDTGTTAKLFWDASAGSLGIGTTSPNTPLDVRRSDASGAVAEFHNNVGYGIDIGTSTTDAYISSGYQQNFIFKTNAGSGQTERIRITSTGELLLNKTSASVGTDGVQLRPSSYSGFSATSTTALFVNRNTNDGDVVEIGKNGVKVGSLGTVGADVTIGTGDTGLRFRDEFDAIQPHNITTNGTVDGVISLGKIGATFKDLHLSGTVNASLGYFSKSGGNNITINSTTANATFLKLQNSVRAYSVTTTYDGALSFYDNTGTSERVRILSSGAFLIGKTALGVNNTGLQFNGGLLAVTKDGGEPLILNRKTTDGVVADFRKDNTSVGNTRSFGGDLIIQTGITGLRFNDANDAIHPVIVNGSVSDGATDLGLTNARFKDLHLSGTANVGSVTSSGNIFMSTNGSILRNSGGALQLQSDASQVILRSNNTTALTLDTSQNAIFAGNVGIGTTSPTETLHVMSGVSNDTVAIISGSQSDRGLTISTYASDGRTDGGVDLDAYKSFKFTTDGTERVRIDSSGNLAIGNVSAAAKLDIRQDSGAAIRCEDGSGAYFVVKQGGTVGIGTPSPDAPLTVHNSSDPEIRFGYSSTQDHKIAWDSSKVFIHADPENANGSSAIGFSVDGTERARIDSSGNFGINTSSPDALLEIDKGSEGEYLRVGGDNASNARSLRFTSSTASGSSVGALHTIKANSVGGEIAFANGNGNIMYLNVDRNVGIGTTSPDTLLHLSANTGATLRLESTDTAIAANEVMGAIEWEGNDATTGSSGIAGKIDVITEDATPEYSMRFFTQDNLSGTYELAERMRIKSDGKVGIGTTSPAKQLHVYQPSGQTGIVLSRTNNIAGVNLQFSVDSSKTRLLSYGDALSFWTAATGSGTNASEKARFDALGNLLVGTTSIAPYASTSSTAQGIALRGDLGFIGVSRPNNSSAYFNRAGTDGAIVNFRKDGTTVGNIGCPDGANGSQLVIAAGTGGTNTGVGLRFTSFTVHNIIPCYDDGSSADNHIDLGNSGARFDDIYATNGTIQTSDRNEKQDIQALTDAEQRVATACKGLIRRFRWQDAVEEKGDDARYHFGVIAQDLQDAFTAEGLDAGDYGMFISSTWTDDDGNEQTRLGVRYNELLAFIITTL